MSIAEEYSGHLVERQDYKHRGQNQNWTTNHGQHSERKTISLAWTCLPYGPPAHTTASTVLAGTRIQERTRSTKSELEECSQQRPTKDRVHLGGSRGGSSWQTRMASECGPLMCSVGCGMNQGQSRSRLSCELFSFKTKLWRLCLRLDECWVCVGKAACVALGETRENSWSSR